MSFTRNLVVLSLALSAFTSVAQAKELVVYSSRQDHLIKPVFEMYTEKTGVKINFITDREAPLMARLRAEGANTPADMFMTVDAGNLWQAEKQGLFQPVQSEVIEGNIPQHLRSSNNMWTRSEEHTSELQSRPHLVCRLLLEKKKTWQRHKSR